MRYAVVKKPPQTWSRLLRSWCAGALLLGLALWSGCLWAQSPTDGLHVGVDDAETIQVSTQQLKAGAAGQFLIALQFPEGYHLNPRAPFHYRIDISGAGIHIADPDRLQQPIAPALPLVIPFQASAGTHQGTATIETTFYYCREDDTGVCVMQSVRWQVPLQTGPDHPASQIVVSYTAEVPTIQRSL